MVTATISCCEFRFFVLFGEICASFIIYLILSLYSQQIRTNLSHETNLPQEMMCPLKKLPHSARRLCYKGQHIKTLQDSQTSTHLQKKSPCTIDVRHERLWTVFIF